MGGVSSSVSKTSLTEAHKRKKLCGINRRGEGDNMKESTFMEVLKEKLEKLAEIELENANCPFMFGEVELPACIKEEMDK